MFRMTNETMILLVPNSFPGLLLILMSSLLLLIVKDGLKFLIFLKIWTSIFPNFSVDAELNTDGGDFHFDLIGQGLIGFD